MTRRAYGLAARLSLVLLAVGASAHAYCVSRTCDRNDPAQACYCTIGGVDAGLCVPDNDSECMMSGHPLFWAHRCASFDVQRDGSPLRGISYDELHPIVLGAAVTWMNVDCGSHKLDIFLNDFGPASCNRPEYNKTQPNANVIMFHDAQPWPHTQPGVSSADVYALTTVTFDPATGEIFDADIEINSADVPFVLGADPNLQDVLTHEMGHFLGLAHSEDGAATMYPHSHSGMRTLEQDDIDGICLAMSNPQRTLLSDCTPRHGFSTDCASADSGGCCSTAAGASVSRAQALALLSFGVGLLGWRARRGLRRSPRATRR